MAETDSEPDPDSDPADEAWYCVRARTKAEHLAAANLRGYANLDEVFCPRIRFEKPTRRGKVWFVEALFPGYLFARFDLARDLRAVRAATGVTGVLNFADRYPSLETSFIDELRAEFPEDGAGIRVISQELASGDEVVLASGAMAGLRTIVTRVMPGQERVRILLDWLGQEREAEISRRDIYRPGDIRAEIRGL